MQLAKRLRIISIFASGHRPVEIVALLLSDEIMSASGNARRFERELGWSMPSANLNRDVAGNRCLVVAGRVALVSIDLRNNLVVINNAVPFRKI